MFWSPQRNEVRERRSTSFGRKPKAALESRATRNRIAASVGDRRGSLLAAHRRKPARLQNQLTATNEVSSVDWQLALAASAKQRPTAKLVVDDRGNFADHQKLGTGDVAKLNLSLETNLDAMESLNRTVACYGNSPMLWQLLGGRPIGASNDPAL